MGDSQADGQGAYFIVLSFRRRVIEGCFQQIERSKKYLTHDESGGASYSQR
jgi:hypothetical protein